MATKPDPLLVDLYRALPMKQLEATCALFKFNPKDPKVFERMARARGLATLIFVHNSFSIGELKAIGKAIGAETHGKTQIALANSIFSRLRENRRSKILGQKISEYNDLYEAASAMARPICLLRPDPSNPSEKSAVAYFNPDAGFEQPWILLSLRDHPNEKLRRDCCIFVESTSYTGGVVVEKHALRPPTKNWVKLFAHASRDLPPLEWLKSQRKLPIRLSSDEEVLAEYENEALQQNVVTAHHYFSKTASRPYDGVYAQTGGFITTWPEESTSQQLKQELVVRTYANSEPWLEVLRNNSGTYRIALRIT